MSDEKTIAFKGFDKDFKCRGYQYEVGKTYEHDGPVNICESGFHACESPLDVWGYYSIVDSRFAVVELSGQKSNDNNRKIAAARIEIKAELALPEYINRAVQWVIDQCRAKVHAAQIGSSGDSAQIGSSGYAAKIGSSGDYAQIGSSGYAAKIGSSGYAAKINVEGKKSVVASAGCRATITGVDGTWVSLAEYNDNGDCVGFATGCIGQDGLKAGTEYRAQDGKLIPNED